MENVNQVRFGNYTIGGYNQKQPEKKEDSKENVQAELNLKQTDVNPEKVLDAMNIAGLQNKIQVSSTSKKEANLLDEGITDIEAEALWNSYLSKSSPRIDAMMDKLEETASDLARDYTELGFSKSNSNTLGIIEAAKDVLNADVVINLG